LLISPNQRVELAVGDGEDRRVYHTRVEDLDEERGYLLLAAPIVDGDIVPIRRETMVTISFYNYDVVHQGRYEAAGVVERRFRDNNVPVLLVNLTTEWQKIQLRDYVRVSVYIDATYNGDIPCRVKDISGGGLLCVTQEELELGSQIYVDLPIGGTIIRLYCRILRGARTEYGFEYGCIFENIDERTRLEIIQYVYKRQIEIYRKKIDEKA